YSSMDLAGRRKNATRETTATLKAWLYEHRKNPYPTKGEKIMLAIVTKMTLTQVSTWFANARRRLKKENKMTWSPRNRTNDDEDQSSDDGDDSEVISPRTTMNENGHSKAHDSGDLSDISANTTLDDIEHEKTEDLVNQELLLLKHHKQQQQLLLHHHHHHHHRSTPKDINRDDNNNTTTTTLTSPTKHHKVNELNAETGTTKPKLWSLADMANDSKCSKTTVSQIRSSSATAAAFAHWAVQADQASRYALAAQYSRQSSHSHHPLWYQDLRQTPTTIARPTLIHNQLLLPSIMKDGTTKLYKPSSSTSSSSVSSSYSDGSPTSTTDDNKTDCSPQSSLSTIAHVLPSPSSQHQQTGAFKPLKKEKL
ncbi:unnamed protein product, partial [Didymodactylos carnosus]